MDGYIAQLDKICETFFMVISDLVIAARPIKDPISIMSGKTRCLHPFRLDTPSISRRLDPIPDILAPIAFNILHNCCK